MKFKRIFGAVLVVVTVLTASANAAASGRDTSSYSFHAGKVGRTEESTPYEGMDYEGGEQGDTSAYGYWVGKDGRTEEDIPYTGMNYEGGEQGDTSAYSFRAGRIGKPWNITE